MYLKPKLNVRRMNAASNTLSEYLDNFGTNFLVTLLNAIITQITIEVTQSYIVFITKSITVVFVGNPDFVCLSFVG